MTDRAFLVAAVVTAGAIGATAWQGPFWLVASVAAVPILAFAQPLRAACFAVMAAYYATASYPMIPALQAASWVVNSVVAIVGLFVAATLLLTAPWVLLWSPSRNARPWRLAAATLVSVVPPVGLIGWASPLLAAGALFPGTGWSGLVLTMMVPVAATSRSFPRRAVTALMVIALIANWVAVPAQAVPGWGARDLSLARPMERIGELEALAMHPKVQSLIESSNADVLILPESAIPRWNDATALIWEPVADGLAATNRLVLAGTTFPEPGSRKQRNGAVVLGLANSIPRISQRLPVPIAMWNPFHDDGFVACPSCPDTFEIAGQRVALSICYEQLLVLPVLLSLAESPSVLVGISSTAWTQQTSIPRSQELCLWAWGRLFRLPVLNATLRLER
jgi:hypothetical protein